MSWLAINERLEISLSQKSDGARRVKRKYNTELMDWGIGLVGGRYLDASSQR